MRRGFGDWVERTLELEKFSAVQKLRLGMYVDFNGNGSINPRDAYYSFLLFFVL